MKKLAIASAIALLGMGAAHAAEITITQPQVAGVFQAGAQLDADGALTTPPLVDNIAGVTTAVFDTMDNMLTTTETTVEGVTTRTGGFDIAVLSGSLNLARINGAIDISGTNVSLSSLASDVTATATATATTSTADAYAIAGAKLETTVIGALNSSTVEVMGKLTEQSNSFGQSIGLANLSTSGQTINMDTSGIAPTLATATTLGNTLTGDDLFDTSIITGTTGQLDMAGLTTNITSDTSNMVSELQNMAVFNTAINAGALDAGIKVVAAVDPNAWFLNPQTGVVNLSNVAMATTAIGALNSSVTRLGANLTPTVTVK